MSLLARMSIISPMKERVRFGRQEWLMEEARIQRPVER